MYQIREVIIKNGQVERKRWIIEFDDPSRTIVGEFLMADASLLNFSVLDDLNKVLSGASDYIETSGNRCALVIRPDQTIIEDLFEGLFSDVDPIPSYAIDTKELRDLVLMWKEKSESSNE